VIGSEGGLYTRVDLADLAQADVRTFLVGESLMRQTAVEAATRGNLANPRVSQGGR